MRKALFIASFTIASLSSYGQQWTGSTTPAGNISRGGDLSVQDGNVTRVTLGPAWGGNPIWGASYLGFNLRRENNALWSYYGDGGSMNAGMVMYNSGDNLFFSLKPSTGGTGGTINDAAVYNNAIMSLKSNGKVAIGRVNGSGAMQLPDGFKLYVEGGILTERVRVATKNSADWQWADYVFDKKYKLMPLQDLKNYINKEKHLPDIPSAQDVAEHGVEMAAMQARLLQKVEELTLYVLQQQKEIEELRAKKQ